MTRQLLLSRIAALGLAAAPAHAASADDPSAQVIAYDSRQLYAADDLKTLLRRIDVAADRVCFDPNGPSPAGTINLVCRAEAVGDAHQQLAEAIVRRKP